MGAKLFESRCAGCHGSDGAGGEHAPTIVENSRRRNLRDTIKNGIKERGMPAFDFSDAEMTALVTHIDALRAPAADRPANGNSQAGQAFFLKNCVQCHMVKGHGGVLGPDLTNIARERRLRTDSKGSSPAQRLRCYRAPRKDGKTLSGIVKNESNYDLQLQGTDGRAARIFESRKSLKKPDKSLMPIVEIPRFPTCSRFCPG